jgi:hypothetical protein
MTEVKFVFSPLPLLDIFPQSTYRISKLLLPPLRIHILLRPVPAELRNFQLGGATRNRRSEHGCHLSDASKAKQLAIWNESHPEPNESAW